MTRIIAALAIGCALALSSPAHAIIVCNQQGCHPATVHHHNKVSHDPRPRAWCGWWLRHYLGVADRSYNQARRWASFGHRANGPAPGVIAVWPHHVGIVVSVPAPGRIVLKSGNDGHAVRERERSARGVIAWRRPTMEVTGL